MARDARQQAVDLTRRLLDRGDRYSFFQAHRLIRLLAKKQGVNAQDAIRVRPRLGLGFPQTDMQSIEEHEPGRYRITANFLGLYGVDSPLPTFYTEDLLNEQADGFAVNREFLDIFAQSIYPLFYEAWLKSRPALRVIEYEDERMLQILYAFVGIENPQARFSQPGVGSLLYCGALFNQQTRTAAGLETVLQACFSQAKVQVRQLQVVWMPIASSQQFELGQKACTLGEDAHLGEQCRTFDGVTIVMQELSISLYRDLLPGGKENRRFQFLVDYYLIEPLPIRVELRLRQWEAKPACLSEPAWATLGRDTWLAENDQLDAAGVSFALTLRTLAKAAA
jgi:type VI secretion system protein ImpH